MDDRWRPSSRSRSRSRSRDRRSTHRHRRSRSHSRERRRHRSISPRHHHRRRSPSPSRSPPSSHRPRHRSPRPISHHHAPSSEQLQSPPPALTSIHRARVVSVRPFGVFVELQGLHRQALVHNSQVADDIAFGRDDDDDMKVKALEFFCPRGESVYVKVVDVKQGRGDARDVKIGCSMKAVDQQTGTDLDPENVLLSQHPGGGGGGRGGRQSDEPPELYSIHTAAIQSVRPFGVFVQLEGYRKYGLVHFSQISDHMSFGQGEDDAERVATLQEVVGDVRQSVMVKVVELVEDEQRGGMKIGCSMKLVSQRDGADLDPGNVKYKPRGGGGGGGGGGFQGGRAPVGAAAGETTQGGMVDWGYLKADVYGGGRGARGSGSGGGGKQYEILAESEEDVDVDVDGSLPPPSSSLLRGGDADARPAAPMMASMGRGRGNILPSWMTTGPGEPPSAPGSLVGAAADGGGPIESVEDALAVLEAYGVKHQKNSKKHHKHHKKKSKHKKEKKTKKKRSSSGGGGNKEKDKDRRRESGSSSDYSSDSRSR